MMIEQIALKLLEQGKSFKEVSEITKLDIGILQGLWNQVFN